MFLEMFLSKTAEKENEEMRISAEIVKQEQMTQREKDRKLQKVTLEKNSIAKKFRTEKDMEEEEKRLELEHIQQMKVAKGE